MLSLTISRFHEIPIEELIRRIDLRKRYLGEIHKNNIKDFSLELIEDYLSYEGKVTLTKKPEIKISGQIILKENKINLSLFYQSLIYLTKEEIESWLEDQIQYIIDMPNKPKIN